MTKADVAGTRDSRCSARKFGSRRTFSNVSSRSSVGDSGVFIGMNFDGSAGSPKLA